MRPILCALCEEIWRAETGLSTDRVFARSLEKGSHAHWPAKGTLGRGDAGRSAEVARPARPFNQKNHQYKQKRACPECVLPPFRNAAVRLRAHPILSGYRPATCSKE